MLRRNGGWLMALLDNQRYHRATVTGLEPAYMLKYGTQRDIVHESLEGPWPFSPKEAFQLIHGDALGGLLADWEGFYANAYKHLLPGGWVEVREHDLRFYPRDEKEMEGKWETTRQWQELLEVAAERFGKPINMGAKQKQLMEKAGFTEIQETVFQVESFLAIARCSYKWKF
ncbi:hypothetical protein BJX70DRAFT_395231 [Aspergillus crustosus]